MRRARALAARGRHREALDAYGAANAKAPASPAIALELASCAWRLGRIGDAERALRDVLAAGHDGAAALALARLLATSGRADEARTLAESALSGHPDRVEALAALARCHRAAGDGTSAERRLREAIALAPDDARLWRDLALLFALGGRDAEADEAAARGWAADDDGALAYALAERSRLRGNYAREAALLVEELARRPNPAGHFMLAEALIVQGRYVAGWRQFEFRRFERAMLDAPVIAGVPPWRGEPLDGRTILVGAEQGIGDVAWFARYLPLLGRRGARVVLLPRADMQRVSRGFAGVDHVLREGEPLPGLDCQVGMMSLAHRFATTLATIPGGVPYLAPEPGVAARWTRAIPDGGVPRVGVVWAGKPAQARDAQRSMRLSQLLPLLRVRGCRFYALQKGPAEAELAGLPGDVAIEPLGAKFDDLEDLCGAIARMDLVVSVCTGPAHLAGAMGKPVWTMVSRPPDLRWMQDRIDSPWYPTMRLFRQSAAGRWDDVVADVAAALEARRDGIVAASRAMRSRDDAPDDGRDDDGLARVVDTSVGVLMADADDPGADDGAWLARVVALAQPADVVMVLGAGVGLAAIALSRAIGRDGHVFADESDARRRALLAANLAAHRATNVSVLEPGEGHDRVDDLALDRLEGIVVDARVDPGAFLDGASETLWRARPWLAVATPARNAHDAASRLRAFGYVVHRVDPRIGPPGQTIALVAEPEERGRGVAPAGCVEWP